MGKPKRLDGIKHLTQKQKAERDARAQYWMNQRKIERVAEAAFKHGWYTMCAEFVEELMDSGTCKLSDDGDLILVTSEGEYVAHEYQFETDDYLVRKILTYPKETNGSNESSNGNEDRGEGTGTSR